mmetsp:Transcript_1426/g.2194  ORF Transcript_1426/g.2194 Transcript_1426/m.2194 type:complete len:431 (-) Transcript_1426:225-1517(-)|eukprot:CAMPEP_0204842392 /NCGR_PEP_ID=MMETSP1346-20131115/46108_1 /ASSEMBLY_ACC=CAM_ASM_000771 /TAXON_ID=215587 /ORGANISM="Aplanochytrium stocchinoi, Strain GSBS06" /LENGTH=430 /DNA_ID=CAMNT_0051981173 /DNA_START=154 /DNA_END=1446 /DNA_ORIENTATION=-
MKSNNEKRNSWSTKSKGKEKASLKSVKTKSKQRKNGRRRKESEMSTLIVGAAIVILSAMVVNRLNPFIPGNYRQEYAHENLYGTNPMSQKIGIDENTEVGIIGGATAPRQRYEYVVNLVSSRSWYCGGSLIHKNWVLTAAHCVTDDEGKTMYPRQVWIGRHDIANRQESYENFTAIEIIAHPSYGQPIMANDFALIRLSGSSKKTPVYVDDGSYTPGNGEMLTVMGWGRITNFSFISLSPVLMEVALDVVEPETCNKKWHGFVDPSMLCAGGHDYKSACNGDSGGPVIFKSDRDKRDVLLGVVSFGHHYCTHKAFPNVYGRASSAREWIESTIGESLPVKSSSGFWGYFLLLVFGGTASFLIGNQNNGGRGGNRRRGNQRPNDDIVAPREEAVPMPFHENRLAEPAAAELEEAEYEEAARIGAEQDDDDI